MSARSETRTPIRIYNALASMTERIFPSRFTPEQLMETAAKKHGSTDFGDNAFLEGLRVLCDSINVESNLHPFGRLSTRNSLINLLRNRLELQQCWKSHPQALKMPVEKPVFIVGPPRTGTTLLLNLLSLDERFRYLRSWEADRPGVLQEDEEQLKRAKAECRLYIKSIYYMNPELKKIHYLAPEKPEECVPLLANSFESGSFAFIFNTESYLYWYVEQDHDYCYTYYYKQLQWLQSQTPGRWLLKSPAHLPAFSMVFKHFPDALILQTHRDPEKIVPSITSLEYAFQSMLTYDTDKKTIGREALNYLAETMRAALESREKNHYNVFDIQYEELVKNPIDILEKVYEHMGESMPFEMRERVNSYLARNPKNRFGKHAYSIEEVGLSKDMIREKFDFYYDRFKFAGA